MVRRTVYNVIFEDGKWKVKKKSAKRASSTHKTQSAAFNKAKEFAKDNRPSQVLLRTKRNNVTKKRKFDADESLPLTWDKISSNRFHHSLRVKHPNKVGNRKYTIDVISNRVEISKLIGNSRDKTRRTFDSNEEALEYAKKRKRNITKELKSEGWEKVAR